MEPFRPDRRLVLRLGDQTYDLTHRGLVMGILNRTGDSFYAPAATPTLDGLLARAERLVADGADILDVGGVRAGPGDPVSPEEELDRAVPAVAALRRRFDVPVSVDTWRASVAAACFAEGAVLGNDISGFADPAYLAVAARAHAAVVATHIRLAPRVPDPAPVYDDVVSSVSAFLASRVASAHAAGVAADRILVDAGLDLGKTAAQSLVLLRSSATLASLGPPLLLSASRKTFLGELFNLVVEDRAEATTAAVALGMIGGCRVLRVHDVRAAVRVRDVLGALSEAATCGAST